MPAQLLELGRISQELDEFANFLLGFVTTGHISKRDGVGRLVKHLGLGLAEGERTAAPATLHLAHEEDPHTDQQDHRKPGNEDVHEEGLLLLGLRRRDLDAVTHQVTHHPDILETRRIDRDLPSVLGGCPDGTAIHDRLGDLALLGVLHELGVFDRVLGGLAVVELVENGHQHDADHQPDRKILE
jgi:hypothetical protein